MTFKEPLLPLRCPRCLTSEWAGEVQIKMEWPNINNNQNNGGQNRNIQYSFGLGVWGWDNFKLSKICTFSFLCHLVIWNYYSKSWLLVTVTYLNVQYYCLLRDFPYWLQLFWLQVKLKSQFGDFRIEVLGYLRSPTILHMATKFNYHVLGVKKIAASGNGVWEQFFFFAL